MERFGADYLGVALPSEGVELRKAGIDLPILVLTTGTEDYPEIIRYGLEPGIPDIYALTRLREELRKIRRRDYPVHINIDTGMHRLGFMEREIPDLINFVRESPEIHLEGLYTHLAASDEAQHDEFTLGQIQLYEKLSSQIMDALPYKPLRHVLNSAGIERFTQYQYDMVRLGIVAGDNNSQLNPAQSVSYEQACVLFFRAYQMFETDEDSGALGAANYDEWPDFLLVVHSIFSFSCRPWPTASSRPASLPGMTDGSSPACG
jgi:alanine racemase